MRAWAARVMTVALAAATLHAAGPATTDEAVEVRLQLADLLFAESRYEEAEEAYARALHVSSAEQRARAAAGVVTSLLRRAEFRAARTRVDALLGEAPAQADLLALRGDALWAGALFAEAEASYRDALAVSPGEARALNGLARAHAAQGRLDAARDAAAAAIALDPRQGDFHHTLGFVLERQRRFAESAAALTNYINLLPDRDGGERALWTRQRVRLLQSFGRREPMAVAGDPDAVHTIPFRIVRDKIVVEGRVNGGRPVDFVVDTGAEMTVISNTVARQRGVSPVIYMLSAGVGQVGLRGLEVGRANTLRFGTLEVANVPVLIKNPPLRDLPTREAESFSPLAFGLSMRIDYERRLMTVARRLPDDEAALRLPLWQHRLTLVRGKINGAAPAHFVVDTGGEVVSLSRATASALDLRPPRHIPLKVYGTSGWDPDAFLLPGVDLAFGRVRLDNFAVVVLNLDAPSALLGFELGGIVGHRFLSRYRVDIDLERSELRLASRS